MAREKKPEQPYHYFRLVEKDRELLIVGKGSSCYLWTGPLLGKPSATAYTFYTFSGQGALTKLGEALIAAARTQKRRK